MGIEAFVKKQLADRETRGRSPGFQAEMASENAEFMDILGDLGENTFDAGVTTLLKTPTTTFLNGLRTLYDKNYHMSDYAKDTLKLFLGKNGVAHSALKVGANALHLAGQGAKIGVRHLFKL